VAFLLARRLAAPLFILAEGTQAVAAGDFSPREALPARDELGVLTQSFNQMTRQLEEARAQAENNRAAVEPQSRLPGERAGQPVRRRAGLRRRMAGLRAANHGAMPSSTTTGRYERVRLEEWTATGFSRCHAGRLAGARGQLAPQIELPTRTAVPRPCWCAARACPRHGRRLGGGVRRHHPLIAAQRTAAWGEVARRLAHEIKNPLTPIQLSAERLQFKLADKLSIPRAGDAQALHAPPS
jgi:HAMP domain-containing protein